MTIFIYYSLPVPDAVDTVICAPDGRRNHPKHVEQLTDKINCAQLHLVGRLLTQNCDARSHGHKKIKFQVNKIKRTFRCLATGTNTNTTIDMITLRIAFESQMSIAEKKSWQ